MVEAVNEWEHVRQQGKALASMVSAATVGLGCGCCATLTADRCCKQSASSATPTLRRAGGEAEIAASEALGRELSDTGLHDHDRASSHQSCGLLRCKPKLCCFASLCSNLCKLVLTLNMSVKLTRSKD